MTRFFVYCANCGRRIAEHFACPHHDGRWMCSTCCGCDPDRGPVGADDDDKEME